jgi:penicillin-binding protein 1A
VVDDVPYMYPGTNISVKNVDGRYMGELLLEEALGYSRNTVALKTLQEVIEKIGLSNVLEYLEEINMLDCEKDLFNMSYGIGGMYNGVTPTQLASAFSMFPSEGIYRKATTIRRIEILNNKSFENVVEEKRVLSEETAFKMSNVLKKVVDNNYWSMGTLKKDYCDIGAKSGTSNFDYHTLKELNYPSGACKDIWYAGFSKDYTATVWTGFDKNLKNEITFFKASNDPRVGVAKKILNKILSLKAKSGLSFTPSKTLYEVGIVRGVYPYVLPDEYTPAHMISYGYFKKEEIPTEFIKPDPLPEIRNILIIQIEDRVRVIFEIEDQIIKEKEYGKHLYSNESVYGKVLFNVKVSDDKIIKSTENTIEFSINDVKTSVLDCYLSYEKREVETSHKYYNFIF